MMAWKAHEGLRNVGTDGQPTIVVLDNIQAYKRLWNLSLGREAQMIVGTGATAAQMEDCLPGAFELAPLLENCKQNKWSTLTIEALEKYINWVHIHAVERFHWVDALIFYVLALTMHRNAFGHMFNDQTCKHQINPKQHTMVQPLGTNNANEVSTQGMMAALSNFLGQLGITEETYRRKLLFFTGNGKAFEGINKVKKLLSVQEGDFRSFQSVRAVLEIWHTKWTDLIRIFQCHWGTGHEVSDPSTLGYLARATSSPILLNLSKVDFYPSMQLLNIAMLGHILDCWGDYLGTDNLNAFFESLAVANRLLCLMALFDDADILVKQYYTTDAYMHTLHPKLAGGTWYSDAPIGPTWGIHSMNSSTTGRDIQLNLDKSVRSLGDLNDHGGASQSEDMQTMEVMDLDLCKDLDGALQLRGLPNTAAMDDHVVAARVEGSSSDIESSDTEFLLKESKYESLNSQSDWALVNSILLMRDGIWFLEVCRTVALGDIGRVWEVLKIWIFTFLGSGHSKYTAYLVKLFCNITYEYLKATQIALFNNWLVNLSGKAGKFHELDLMQEHFNKYLEEFAQHKEKEFGDEWYRDVLSIHIHNFMHLSNEIEEAVNLTDRSSHHINKCINNKLRLVI
ncbi:hypothetical protein HETIRDRAFT_311808 [Heterobasidion irregulare TC 32-1]|uniref:DUF6589 domain-containing protein n=1 Tax=Heterobasidion irregulare (strain TC 32-1) TaxID=747525 RepID=W4KHZ0_HETIT|nr:uncharacterized protein HETIRDRAFT_314095 [Heterobasidion irregulare TC 32-1]XP_009544566.1 uncharacterized protein HETIRDRAFT_311808 [Heterobasidion irregulare TC 32-1]ETW84935.1 hypothetical protein HETIRDRAFT_314095 [Heterobasidion irregulare TC 32-1]ETW84945.1 hypothetical protein HETIRDRAFT_311808 [Heterobasidion irregulare TC 32-1]